MILAHGVAASKDEWSRFAERLAAAGVGTLAVDLRGHGESRQSPDGPRTFEDFDATGEWPRATLDLAAAARWLNARGVPDSRIAYGGASIGANLAASAAGRRKSKTFLLLLSAGADYRGVRLALPGGTEKILAAASPGDGYAYSVLPELAKLKVDTLSAPAGHGAQMFDDSAVLDKIAAWVVEASRRAP